MLIKIKIIKLDKSLASRGCDTYRNRVYFNTHDTWIIWRQSVIGPVVDKLLLKQHSVRFSNVNRFASGINHRQLFIFLFYLSISVSGSLLTCPMYTVLRWPPASLVLLALSLSMSWIIRPPCEFTLEGVKPKGGPAVRDDASVTYIIYHTIILLTSFILLF